MDTKLKNINDGPQNNGGPQNNDGRRNNGGWRTLDIVAWIIALVSGVTAGYFGSRAVSMMNMINMDDWKEWHEGDKDFEDYMNPWCVYMEDRLEFNDYIVHIGTIACICALVFLAAVICICIASGRFKKNQDGTIYLNWFDRLWSEIQVALMGGATTLAVCLAWPLVEIWHRDDRFEVYEPLMINDHLFGPDNDFIIRACLLGMAVLIAIAILSLVTVVKKMKAHMFWEKSLIIGSFIKLGRWIKKTFKGSDDTLFKVVAVMIVGCVLSATWLGLPVVIVLILIFVPKIVDRFADIRKGVAEVKNGNLNYKIPVTGDKDGIKGEMDRLAEGINEISQASSLAVQNELKNQRMKTELISNVSHDLKTPLTSMVSYIDLLKTEGLDSPNAPEYLNIIDDKTQRLKVLTENLFEAAKASSGAIPVHMESIDMASIVNQSVGEMYARLEERGLEVIVKNLCDEGTPEGTAGGTGDGTADSGNPTGGTNPTSGARVKADGQLLWRVVENLLGNVCKYALENSRVYINLSQPPSPAKAEKGKEYILLEIKNISKDQLNISADELMERFTRGDESRNTEGSGLGLAIAKDLTKLMDGVFEITVDGDLFKASVMMEKAL